MSDEGKKNLEKTRELIKQLNDVSWIKDVEIEIDSIIADDEKKVPPLKKIGKEFTI